MIQLVVREPRRYLTDERNCKPNKFVILIVLNWYSVRQSARLALKNVGHANMAIGFE